MKNAVASFFIKKITRCTIRCVLQWNELTIYNKKTVTNQLLFLVDRQRLELWTP